MKLITFFVALSSLLSAKFSPSIDGSGKISSERRPLTSFREIQISGKAEVFITIGDKNEIVIEGDDNILPLVHTEINNEILSVSTKKQSYSPTLPLVYKITTPHLHAIRINGAGNIKGLSEISGNAFSLIIAGSANADLPIHVTHFNLQISGSGSCTATGYGRNQIIGIAGSGKFYGYDLKGDNITIKITGAGKADVYPVHKLNATLTGSGKIRYIGDPTVKQKITGSGTIEYDFQGKK